MGTRPEKLHPVLVFEIDAYAVGYGELDAAAELAMHGAAADERAINAGAAIDQHVGRDGIAAAQRRAAADALWAEAGAEATEPGLATNHETAQLDVEAGDHITIADDLAIEDAVNARRTDAGIGAMPDRGRLPKEPQTPSTQWVPIIPLPLRESLPSGSTRGMAPWRRVRAWPMSLLPRVEPVRPRARLGRMSSSTTHRMP